MNAELREFTRATIERPMILEQRIKERPHSVFFYPVALYDWRAVQEFASLCDTFIYCDVAINHDHFNQGLEELLALGATIVQEPDEIAAGPHDICITGQGPGGFALGLGVDAPPDWLQRHLSPEYAAAYQEAIGVVQQHGGPWGRQFTCQIGGREITVYCFRAEAFHCYTALFTRHNVAPKVVCMKKHKPGHRWFVDMGNWYAPLGRSVAESPQPELLIKDLPGRTDCNWPWHREWKQYNDWQAVAYWRQHPVTWPTLPPSHP